MHITIHKGMLYILYWVFASLCRYSINKFYNKLKWFSLKSFNFWLLQKLCMNGRVNDNYICFFTLTTPYIFFLAKVLASLVAYLYLFSFNAPAVVRDPSINLLTISFSRQRRVKDTILYRNNSQAVFILSCLQPKILPSIKKMNQHIFFFSASHQCHSTQTSDILFLHIIKLF